MGNKGRESVLQRSHLCYQKPLDSRTKIDSVDNKKYRVLFAPPYSFILSISRPHWEKCAQYVEGGTDRWNELSQNRSSDELVDVLLAEMTGQDIAIIQAGVSTGAEYFQGQVKIIRTRRMILVVYLTLLQISMVVMIYNN